MQLLSKRLLLLVLVFASCSDDTKPAQNNTVLDAAADVNVQDSGADADAATEVQHGSLGETFELRWTSEPALELVRDETVLLTLPADALQLVGVVDAVDPAINYDPYGLINDARVPPAPPVEDFRPPIGATATSDENAVAVQLDFGDGIQVRLDITEGATGRFDLKLTPVAGIERIAIFRISALVDTQEGFYGLGEVFDDVNHRGHARAMQLEIQTGIESANNEAHVPIPLVIGTRGWGLFVNSFHPGAFDVAKTTDDRVTAYFATAQDSADGLEFHLLAADHPLDITRHYHDLTGKPVMPARWALGPWIWRDENDDQAQVISDANTIRDLDLATTGYWIDRPYATAVNTFDFNAMMFPDPQAMIDTVHDLGFRMALWHTPYLDTSDPATQALRDVATAQQYYPSAIGLVLNNWGPPIDLSNPDAYDWWQSQIQMYIDMGIEGFKLDYGEDVVVGVGLNRQVWEFANGLDERTMQALYQHYYHGAYADLLPQTGGFLLCRRGTIGDQTRVSVIWPGDLDANMAKHGDEVTDGEESYNAVGGLPAALIAGLSLGPAGYPLFGSDTGGYRHSPPNKETFVRWFQVTALSPVMQVGTSSNDVPWEFNADNGFDTESLDLYRIFARLHLRLFPYVWTYLENVQIDGRPIQRALGLAYPELGVHPNDVFLLGDHILAAPVVEAGATTRTFTLPPGEWLEWWTGERVQGPGEITVDAPLDTLPLYLSANGIVPMLRPTIDTLAPVEDAQRVDSYATSAGRLHVRVAFGAAATFEVFDGATLETSVSSDWQLTAQTGDEMNDGVEWEILGAPAVSEVILDGTPLPMVAALDGLESGYLVDGNLLRVRVPAGSTRVVVR